MSTKLWRILGILSAFAVVVGLVLGGAHLVRWGRQLSDDYGDGFVVIVGLMAMLVLISIFRMPLSHAHLTRHRRR